MKQAITQSKDKSTALAAPAHMLRGRHRRWAIVGLATTLLVLIVLTAAVGSARISVATVYQVLLHRLPFMSAAPAWTASAETIVIDIRLPRIVMAAVVGASLALAGATYQGLFRNPLADPYLIGVSQGAALGAVLGFLLPTAVSPVGMGLVPLTAFTGALLAATAVYLLAKVGKTLPMTTLILAGVAVGAFFSSVTSYLLIASSDKFRGIITWLVGGFYMSNWSEVMVLLPYAAIGTAVILLYSRPLNVMQLDEEQAQQLGINVERVKLILLAAATLITAAAVSFAGTIGFVGILVPHAVRLIWGPDHRSLMPLSALCGAIFMVLTDALVRGLGMLSSNLTEIPVGVVTAFLGAPFFLYLLRQRKRAVF